MPFKSQNRTRNQTAVYWTAPTSDGLGGRTFTVGSELSVRWEDTQEAFTDRQGQEQVSRAKVFVGEDVAVGGYLYLGTLSGLSAAQQSDPLQVPGAYEIKSFGKVPSVDGVRFTRKVWL